MADNASDNIDELKQRLEAASLRSQIAALTTPWWRKAGLLTVATGIIAAVLPVNSAIQQHYKTQRDISLQEAKQDNDIRTAYLDRYQLPGHRLRTLRFLAGTSGDSRLVAWAEAEIPIVKAELAEIDRQLAERKKELSELPPGKTKEEVQKEIDDLKRLKDAASFAGPGTGTGTGSGPAPGPVPSPGPGPLPPPK